MSKTYNTVSSVSWGNMAFSKRLSRVLLKGRTVSGTSHRCLGQPAAQTHPHLLQNGEVTPGITREEFSQRRYQLMEMVTRTTSPVYVGKKHIIVIPSAPKVYMTHDIPYTFRQHTDFLYLCGFMEPDAILVLESKDGARLPEHSSTLFVPKRDPKKELWEGARSGIDGALELTGVDSAYNMEDFSRYLDSHLQANSGCVTWYDTRKPAHLEFHQMYMVPFMNRNKYGFLKSPRPLIQSLRVVKSEAEIALMEKTCTIAAESFIDLMKYSQPNICESHLFAKMDYECRIRGAEYLAYPPVVAGGNRANTIHYISNNQLIKSGEMVLMDAGCECHGYASDITRTWPVSGKFTAAQRALYEALLEVQEDCIKLCDGKMSIEMVFHEMLTMLGKQLQRLGIIKSSFINSDLQRLAREFCPHHVGHYLGMDVHDTDEISRAVLLRPGMVVTVEPGIYIPESRDDVLKEFRGNGLRIEDDVLITNKGPKVLTLAAPKHPDEIEKVMSA